MIVPADESKDGGFCSEDVDMVLTAAERIAARGEEEGQVQRADEVLDSLVSKIQCMKKTKRKRTTRIRSRFVRGLLRLDEREKGGGDIDYEDRWRKLVTDNASHDIAGGGTARYHHTPGLFYKFKTEINEVTVFDAPCFGDRLFKYKFYYMLNRLCAYAGIGFGLFGFPL